MKSPKTVVTIFGLLFVVIGGLSIYFFVEKSGRPILVFLLVAVVLLIRQVLFKVISNKVK